MKTTTLITKKITLILSVLALSLTFNSCGKDFLETTPTNRVSVAEAMNTFEGAMMAVNGIHGMMFGSVVSPRISSGSIGAGHGIGSLWLTVDHLGDDFVMWNHPQGNWFIGMYDWADTRREMSSMIGFPYHWCYQIIGNANRIIERIDEFDASDNDRNFVLGQALFYRAFGHFWAVQLWGHRYVLGDAAANARLGVPLVTSSELIIRPRSTTGEVYAQINADLTEAIRLLDGNPSAINRRNNSHINGNVAHGLMARVALVQQRWADAAYHARRAQEGVPIATARELLNGFHTTSAEEWIWGINHQSVSSGSNFGNFISLNMEGGSQTPRNSPRLINRELYNMMDPNDIRRDWWITDNNDPRLAALRAAGFLPSGQPTLANQKFRVFGLFSPVSSTSMLDLPMMRGSEMFLIEAEAEAREGNYNEARIALTRLMDVRVPGFSTTNEGEALIDEIMINRRIELWGEGHRFLDLKRLGLPLVRTGAQGHLIAHAGDQTINADGTPVVIPASDPRWNLHLPRWEIEPSRGIIVQNP
ncbi:MAG: RagB/SusD family nutrient uptake outer membrane protein [Bacteroidales bacterium]|nr:RagB/SusD family nutrient uptake outer membrane protein [Bacteroidales bacterium]